MKCHDFLVKINIYYSNHTAVPYEVLCNCAVSYKILQMVPDCCYQVQYRHGGAQATKKSLAPGHLHQVHLTVRRIQKEKYFSNIIYKGSQALFVMLTVSLTILPHFVASTW